MMYILSFCESSESLFLEKKKQVWKPSTKMAHGLLLRGITKWQHKILACHRLCYFKDIFPQLPEQLQVSRTVLFVTNNLFTSSKSVACGV